MLLGYCNWPGDNWLLSSSPLPVSPSAHPLTHAGGLTSSPPRVLCLLPIHNFSSLPMVKNECLLINTSRGHWISSVNGSTVCHPLTLSSLSLSVAARSVCGLGELWSPVTPWIRGSVVGVWSVLFCEHSSWPGRDSLAHWVVLLCRTLEKRSPIHFVQTHLSMNVTISTSSSLKSFSGRKIYQGLENSAFGSYEGMTEFWQKVPNLSPPKCYCVIVHLLSCLNCWYGNVNFIARS